MNDIPTGLRGYRHLRDIPRGSLYKRVRDMHGWTQEEAGSRMGLTRKQWQYREQRKCMYWPGELLMLQQVTGLDGNGFMDLLRECL